MPFDKKASLFNEFSEIYEEKENNSESMRNYTAYKAGKEPLKYAIINHREGDSVFDFISSQKTKNFSVFPENHWNEVRKKYRKDLENSISKNTKNFDIL